jgi:hypothetical protein
MFIVVSKNNVYVLFFFSFVGEEMKWAVNEMRVLYSIQVGLSTLPSPALKLSYIIRIRSNVSSTHPRTLNFRNVGRRRHNQAFALQTRRAHV